jgi:hypothetical protein
VWKIFDFWADFVLLLEIQTNCKKIGFGSKNQLSPQCVHTWAGDTS